MIHFIKLLSVYISIILNAISPAEANTARINWILVSSHLTDENDIIRLSCVCKLTYSATKMLIAWKGILKKHSIEPKQAPRFLNILRPHIGKEQIKVDSSEFNNLDARHIRPKADKIEDLERFSYYILYLTPITYAKLTVENEFTGNAKLEK